MIKRILMICISAMIIFSAVACSMESSASIFSTSLWIDSSESDIRQEQSSGGDEQSKTDDPSNETDSIIGDSLDKNDDSSSDEEKESSKEPSGWIGFY